MAGATTTLWQNILDRVRYLEEHGFPEVCKRHKDEDWSGLQWAYFSLAIVEEIARLREELRRFEERVKKE